MGKNKTLAPIKKQYIKTLMEQGDPRSYNEIQADLELELWHQRFNSTHEITSAMEKMVDEIESPKTEEDVTVNIDGDIEKEIETREETASVDRT